MHSILIKYIEKATLWSAKETREFLNSVTFGRSVDVMCWAFSKLKVSISRIKLVFRRRGDKVKKAILVSGGGRVNCKQRREDRDLCLLTIQVQGKILILDPNTEATSDDTKFPESEFGNLSVFP